MQFSEVILQWYAENGRALPWRESADPYKIWVSEIILQQTRVAQGMDYYRRFLRAFPTVEALAEADEDAVMKQWQGLGYYSRARNLHAAARQVAERGAFPSLRQREEQMDILRDQIQLSLRAGDVFTRYTSCQFLVMVCGADMEQSEMIAERITGNFKRSMEQWEGELLHHCYPLQKSSGKR